MPICVVESNELFSWNCNVGFYVLNCYNIINTTQLCYDRASPCPQTFLFLLIKIHCNALLQITCANCGFSLILHKVWIIRRFHNRCIITKELEQKYSTYCIYLEKNKTCHVQPKTKQENLKSWDSGMVHCKCLCSHCGQCLCNVWAIFVLRWIHFGLQYALLHRNILIVIHIMNINLIVNFFFSLNVDWQKTSCFWIFESNWIWLFIFFCHVNAS